MVGGKTISERLISVIVPAFNAAVTVEQTLESIRAQTHANLQILVVDDGSCDGTADVVRRLAADPRVQLIRQPNAGVAAARNRGLEAAQGDLVALCDADDLWSPTKLEQQLQALDAQAGSPALCYCGFVTIDAHGRRAGGPVVARAHGEVLERLCRRNFVGHASSMLFRRELAERLGGFDETLRVNGAQGCEDYDFLLRAAETGPFAAAPADLVGYRVGAGGTMSSNFVTMMRSWVIVTAALVKRRPDLLEAVKDGRAYYAAQLMIGAASRGRLRTVVALARESQVGARRLAGYLLVDGVKRLMIRSKRFLVGRGPRGHFLPGP